MIILYLVVLAVFIVLFIKGSLWCDRKFMERPYDYRYFILFLIIATLFMMVLIALLDLIFFT